MKDHFGSSRKSLLGALLRYKTQRIKVEIVFSESKSIQSKLTSHFSCPSNHIDLIVLGTKFLLVPSIFNVKVAVGSFIL